MPGRALRRRERHHRRYLRRLLGSGVEDEPVRSTSRTGFRGEASSIDSRTVSIYRLHDTAGDDLELLEHPELNLEPGHVVVLADGREALVTSLSRGGATGTARAALEVAVTHSVNEEEGES